MRVEDMTLKQLSESVKEAQRKLKSEREQVPVTCPVPIILYICPTKECGNHFSATAFHPSNKTLHTLQNKRSQKGGYEPTHTRVECPDCRDRGLSVDRVPYMVIEVIELDKFQKLLKKRKSEA